MTHNLSDIYRHYVIDGGTLEKHEFKNICCDFNTHIMNHIIYEAGKFDMGNFLSYISVVRIKRNYKKLIPDWKSSNERKAQLLAEGKQLYDPETKTGENWLVYYTDEWYCRFYWAKKYCKVKNRTVYKFVATRGNIGNKTKLKRHLQQDDINHLKYKNASV